MLIGWQDPPSWDPEAGQEAEPPGRGRFLATVGGRPGIPFRVQLTAAEAASSDTNSLWHARSRVGSTGPTLIPPVPLDGIDLAVDEFAGLPVNGHTVGTGEVAR